jgi:hypothetical protein
MAAIVRRRGDAPDPKRATAEIGSESASVGTRMREGVARTAADRPPP